MRKFALASGAASLLNDGHQVCQTTALPTGEGQSGNARPAVSLTAQCRSLSAGNLHFPDLGANRPVIRRHAGHDIDIGIRVRP